MSLWVGGIVLAAMMKVAVDDDFLATLVPFRLHEIYLGRFCLFALFSLLQSSLMLAGELLFFGIQCQDPLLYLKSENEFVQLFPRVPALYELPGVRADIGAVKFCCHIIPSLSSSSASWNPGCRHSDRVPHAA